MIKTILMFVKPLSSGVLIKFNNWFYCIFLILLPLVYFGNLLDPVLISRQLYLSVFLSIIIIVLLFKNIAGFHCDFGYLKNKAIYTFMLFLIINLISISFSNTVSEALYVCSKVGLLFTFLLITIHLIYNNNLQIKTITESLIIMSLVIIFIGVYQIIIIFFSVKTVMNNINFISSSIANKNLFSSFLFLTLPFSLLGLKRIGVWKLFSCISILFTILFIWLLQTRAVLLGAFIALITGFIVYSIFNPKKHQQQISITFSFLKSKTTLFSLLLLFSFAVTTFYYQEKFEYLKNVNSIRVRLLIWGKTVQIIQDNPLGVGTGNWQVIFPAYGLENIDTEVDKGMLHFQRPHNDFLWIMAETGIAGIITYLVFFIFVLSSLIKKLITTTKQNEFWLYLFIFSGFIGYFIISFSDFPYERIEHQILVMLFVAIALSDSSTTKTMNIHAYKKIFSFFLLSVLFSLIICINRISGEKHTRFVIDAQHKGDWIKMKKEAEKALNTFYTMDPMSTPIYWYIGVADFSLKNFEEAKDDFLKAYSIHPNHIHVLNNLASSYEKTNNHSKAIKYYLKAIEISPLFLEARLNLCGAYFNSGDYENAFMHINLYPYYSTDTKYITFLKAILASKMDRIINTELNISVKESLLKIKSSQDLLLKYFVESKEVKVDFEEFIISRIN